MKFPVSYTHLLVSEDAQSAVLKRTLDATTYYVTISWEGPAKLSEKSANYFVLTPTDSIFTFTCQFTPQVSASPILTFTEVQQASSGHWKNYWTQGAVADFSQCTDVRAKELERRVVLSQYLLAIQCAGSTPPQETGLTYNSWFGKFHLEMIWWHQAQFALWLDGTIGNAGTTPTADEWIASLEFVKDYTDVYQLFCSHNTSTALYFLLEKLAGFVKIIRDCR